MSKRSSKAQRKAPKKFPVVWLLAILGLTLVSFFPALTNGFTQWDDNIYVTENPLIASLSLSNIVSIFSTSHNGVYVPLTMTSYALENAVFGKNPKVFHATNVILHLANAGLVAWLLFLFFKRETVPAVIAAALFSVHPLRVESVAWVAERKDLLCALFFFLSLLSYGRYAETANRRFLRRSLILFLCSLLSKPMALTLPFVLLLMDATIFGRAGRKAVVEKIPFFGLSLAFAVIAVLANDQSPLRTAAATGVIAAGVRKTAVVLYSFGFYVLKILFPTKLAAVYPYTEKIDSLDPALLYLSPVIFALLTFVAVRAYKRSKPLFFGLVFFGLTLIPILQVISLPGNTIVADRYSYIPGFGAAAIAGLAVAAPSVKKKRGGRILLPAVFAGLIAVFAVSTFARCRVWKNDPTLWNDVLEKYPRVAVAHNKIGLLRAEAGNLEAAIEEYDRAIAIDDAYVGAYNNRAIANRMLRRYDPAVADYDKIISLTPSYTDAFYNLGNLYHEIGREKEAVEAYGRALQLAPKSAKVYNNRGMAYIALDDLDRAYADFSKALEIQPNFDLALVNRGLVLTQLKRFDEAIEDLNLAVRTNPKIPSAHFALGLAYEAKGDYPKALAEMDAAIGLKPDFEEAVRQRQRIALLIKNDAPSGAEDGGQRP
jgi:tetratricopeptide (TPR) repeat protein